MNTRGESAPWYEEWFDRAEYEIVYRQRDDEDAGRLLDLLERVTRLTPGSRVLDMACGRGRHSKQLARHGYDVTGIDLSQRAIDLARRSAADEGLQIKFQVGDMRNSPCTACFDLVANLFTSFGYFDDDEENARAISAMAEALKPKGWFVQDFMNARYWASNFVPYDEQITNGLTLKQRRWLEKKRLNKEITLTSPDGSARSFIESVRLFDLDDFERMYTTAGLRIVEVFGEFDGRPYDDSTRRLILFATKAEPTERKA